MKNTLHQRQESSSTWHTFLRALNHCKEIFQHNPIKQRITADTLESFIAGKKEQHSSEEIMLMIVKRIIRSIRIKNGEIEYLDNCSEKVLHSHSLLTKEIEKKPLVEQKNILVQLLLKYDSYFSNKPIEALKLFSTIQKIYPNIFDTMSPKLKYYIYNSILVRAQRNKYSDIVKILEEYNGKPITAFLEDPSIRSLIHTDTSDNSHQTILEILPQEQ